MTESRLDYGLIQRAVGEISWEFAAMLPGEDLAARLDAQLRREAASTEQKIQADMERVLRADCELLWVWRESRLVKDGYQTFEEARREVLTFVLERRQIIDWPSWADGWVGGGE